MSEEANSIKIAILEQRVNDFFNVITKIDTAIEKLNEVNTNIIKMLAVHEEKIGQTEKFENMLIKMFDENKINNNIDRKDAYIKLEEFIKDTKREIDDLKKYKWLSIAFGTMAAILISGIFQLASNWDAIETRIIHPTPLTPSK